MFCFIFCGEDVVYGDFVRWVWGFRLCSEVVGFFEMGEMVGVVVGLLCSL